MKCKYRVILHCKNSTFGFLYDEMLEIIEKEGIELNEILQKLVEDMQVGCYGVGLDIADYIREKSDADFFIKLVREAIECYEKRRDVFPLDIRSRFWEFYAELLRYAESLEGHPGRADMVKLDEDKEHVWYRFEHDISSDENKSQKDNILYGYCKFNKETGEFGLNKEKTDSYFLNEDNAIVNSARNDLLTVQSYNLYYPTKIYKHY